MTKIKHALEIVERTKIQRVLEVAERLKKLADAPQPGLSSWHHAVQGLFLEMWDAVQ